MHVDEEERRVDEHAGQHAQQVERLTARHCAAEPALQVVELVVVDGAAVDGEVAGGLGDVPEQEAPRPAPERAEGRQAVGLCTGLDRIPPAAEVSYCLSEDSPPSSISFRLVSTRSPFRSSPLWQGKHFLMFLL